MHDKVSKAFFISGLAVLLAYQACPAQELPPPALYAKRDTLQQTLLATRAALTNWQKEQAALRPALRWGAWHAAELAGQAAPPPVDLAAKGPGGAPLWSPRLDLRDDVVVTLGGNAPAAKPEVFGRTVTAKAPATLTVGLGGGDRIEVWLNGQKLAEQDTRLDFKRYGTSMRQEGDRRSQWLLELPLKAGENALAVSVRQSRAPGQFFFSPAPDPVPRLWERLRKDFPPASNPLLKSVGVAWFENSGWLAATDPHFEREFLSALFERQPGLAKSLYPRLDALEAVKAPSDDPRWLGLCVTAADAECALDDLARLEKAVELLDRTCESYRTYDFSSPLRALRQTALRGEPVRAALDGLKRRSLVQENPLLKNQKLLFARRYTYDSQHYYDDYYHGPTQWGGNLTELDLASGKTREIVPQLAGGIFDRYDISPDGKRVLFGYRAPRPEGFRLWEQNLDGPGLRQLTFPPSDEAERIARHSGYPRELLEKDPRYYGHWTDDMHPCYLPDGRIVFVSSRSERTVLCGDHALTCTSLYRIDADGKNLFELSQGALTESTPTVLDDGRILYTRWEYVYKGIAAIQSLWAMRPDGTGSEEIYGHNIDNPGVFFAGRQIPGKPDRIVALGCGHEPLAAGSIRLIDRKKDRRTKEAMTSLTPEVETRGLRGLFQLRNGKWSEDVFGPLFTDPFPLSDSFFLVSHNPDKRYNDVNGYGIYLLDVFGNRVPLFQDPEMSCFQPMLLAPRPAAPILPALSAPAEPGEGEATVLLVDLYRSLTNVPPGTVKHLRILEQIPRSWAASQIQPGDSISGQNPAVSLFTHIWIAVLLGVVPVEADGSAFFKVPARRNIFVQALDENFMEVQVMRTFVNFQPGETRSCIGCHDPRDGSQMPERPLAMLKPAVALRPQPGDAGPRPLHYPSDVQPILDRHCVRCHSGDAPKGNLNLAGTFTEHFSESYENLLRKGLVPFIQEWTGPRADKGGPLYVGNGSMMHAAAVPPYTYGSHPSKLIQTLLKGHQKVKLEQAEFVRLVTWVDANAQFYGSYFGRRNRAAKDRPGFRAAPTLASARGVPPPSVTAPPIPAELLATWRRGADKPIARGAGTNEGDTGTLNVQRSTLNAQVADKGLPERFDGTTFVTGAPAGEQEAVSVALWLRADELKNRWTPLLFTDGRVASAFHLSLLEDGTPNIAINAGNENWKHVRADAAAKTGEWHHVAVACDPRLDGEARFYIDGKPAGVKRLDLGVPLALAAYRLGAWSAWESAPANNFHGALDDVRLYRGLLTAAEVAALVAQSGVRTPD
jgi:hypothetical protein